MSPEMPNRALEPDPEFRQRYTAIFEEWQAGSLPIQKTLERLSLLKDEAVSTGHLANEAGLETIHGIIQGYRANLDASIQHFERARQLYEQVGNRRRVATCTLNIGETYRLKGNFSQAQRNFHIAYERACEFDDRSMQALALTNEGQMLFSMGHLTKAGIQLGTALELSSQPFDDGRTTEETRHDNLCEIHHALATICLQDGRAREAWEHAHSAYEIARKLNKSLRMGYANRAIAEVITAMGEAPEEGFNNDPDVYYKAATDSFREIKAEGEMARTMYLEAGSMAKRGKKRAAARLYQQVMIIFTKLGMTDDAAKAAEAQLKLL